jgi:hypothetical protein
MPPLPFNSIKVNHISSRISSMVNNTSSNSSPVRHFPPSVRVRGTWDRLRRQTIGCPHCKVHPAIHRRMHIQDLSMDPRRHDDTVCLHRGACMCTSSASRLVTYLCLCLSLSYSCFDHISCLICLTHSPCLLAFAVVPRSAYHVVSYLVFFASCASPCLVLVNAVSFLNVAHSIPISLVVRA